MQTFLCIIEIVTSDTDSSIVGTKLKIDYLWNISPGFEYEATSSI